MFWSSLSKFVKCLGRGNISLIGEIKIDYYKSKFNNQFSALLSKKTKKTFKMNADKKLDTIFKSLNKIEEKIFKIESKIDKISKQMDLLKVEFAK